MKIREVIKLIEQDGWVLEKQKGSHKQFKHPVKSGKVILLQVNQISTSQRVH